MAEPLRFQPLQSGNATSFWQELAARKLDLFR